MFEQKVRKQNNGFTDFCGDSHASLSGGGKT